MIPNAEIYVYNQKRRKSLVTVVVEVVKLRHKGLSKKPTCCYFVYQFGHGIVHQDEQQHVNN